MNFLASVCCSGSGSVADRYMLGDNADVFYYNISDWVLNMVNRLASFMLRSDRPVGKE